MQRMPRQDRALHPRRQVAHAREHRQSPEMVRGRHVKLAGRHVPEFLDHLLSVAPALALDCGRHHRGRSLANGARLTLETDSVQRVVVQFQRQGQVVPAQRVVTLGPMRRIEQHAPIARLAVVIEDYLLIQILRISHGNR